MTDNGNETANLAELFSRQGTPESAAYWAAIFDVVSDPIMVHDQAFRIVTANRAYIELAGAELDTLRGQPYWRFFPCGETPLPSCGHALGDKQSRSDDEFSLPDGRVFLSRGFAVYDPDNGRHRVSVHIFQDITHAQAIEAELRHREQQFRLMADALTDVFWLAHADLSAFEYVSPAFDKLWGIPGAMLLEQPQLYFLAIHPDDREHVMHEIRHRQGESLELEYRLLRPDGKTIWVAQRHYPVAGANESVPRMVGVVSDISEHKAQEELLRFHGTHDQLTGLPNRLLIKDRLEQALALADRHQALVAVLFIDLDRFKLINDSLGHSVGDCVLREVAARLQQYARKSDTVGRLGGDEFVVLLPALAQQDDVVEVARRFLQGLTDTIDCDGHELHVSASAGIGIYPRDGADVETLLRNADTAMYRAKELGRNTFQFFTSELNTRVLERLTVESALRHGLERDEFELAYQPQLDLHTGYITGLEALLRWNHPEHGLVSPGQFIPIAEETGLIVSIGEWVLHQVCAQLAQWQQEGLPVVTVAVNASLRQFYDGKFSALVRHCLDAHGVDPKLLEIELTESMLAERPDELLRELNRLKGFGVQLALDDFGTGYSSLNYLRRYPFDTLKVDQSFVRDVTTNPDNATITRTIIAMAHGLGMRVIAEGVETAEQASYLRRGYCDEMQGFFFGEPMPVAKIYGLLQQRDLLSRSDLPLTDERHTLLIVDDDKNVISALERLLRNEGYRVLAAGDAEEGMRKLALHGAAVVISDQRMPGMSGVEFLAAIKDIHPKAVRILLTGYPDVATATDAVNTGAVFKFMTKPWDNAEVLAVVREAFRRHELHIGPGSFS